MPGVLQKGLDLAVADGAGFFAEEHVVERFGVEGRVEVDEVYGVVGDVMAEDVEVVAVVEDVGFHCGNDSVCSCVRYGWMAAPASQRIWSE